MSAPRPLPPSNRILAAGWLAEQHLSHQKRLSSIKPMTDSSAPKAAKVKIRGEKKRVTRELELERIDRENRILLERMTLIKSKPSPDLPHGPPHGASTPIKKASLNSYVRQKEQERILEENSALIQRLKKGRGHFAPDEFTRHETEYRLLKEAASIARAPPSPLPQLKHHASQSNLSVRGGSDSDRKENASSSRSLSKSHSSVSVGSRRPTSSQGLVPSSSSSLRTGVASSESSRSSGLSSATLSRPLGELRDSNGPVRSIVSDTYPSTLSPDGDEADGQHTSQHSVQLKHDGEKKIDGRQVMVTVEEMTAVRTGPAGGGGSGSGGNQQQHHRNGESNNTSSTRTNEVLHSFLFRTYDHIRLTHDYVSVPFNILSSLPECMDEPSLVDPSHREQLADRMFGRLRFHEGRLAFNPSIAFKILPDGRTEWKQPEDQQPVTVPPIHDNGTQVIEQQQQQHQQQQHPSSTSSSSTHSRNPSPKRALHPSRHSPTSSKKKSAAATSASASASASASTPAPLPLSRTWDMIAPDGRLSPTGSYPHHGRTSPDLGLTPRDEDGGDRHHSHSTPSHVHNPATTAVTVPNANAKRSHPPQFLSPTTTALVRANVSAQIVERTIRHRQEEQARKKDFEAHIRPNLRGTHSPTRTKHHNSHHNHVESKEPN